MPRFIIMLVVVLAAGRVLAQPESPTLELRGDSGAGHVTVIWSTAQEDAWRFQVEESLTADFAEPTVRYEGHQTATVRSGLTDGTYHYRVRKRAADSQSADWSAWSEPASFEVKHHALELAFGLLALGAVVFASTLTFLVVGSRRVETHG